ncbi:MAG: transglycosylase domain-containing protein [Alphaproteobacteria bacterium]
MATGKSSAKKSGGKSSSAKSKDNASQGFLKRSFKFVFKWMLVAAIWGGIILTCTVVWLSLYMPSIDDIDVQAKRPTVVLQAEDGTEILRIGDSSREIVPVSELPRHLVDALIASEDRRFRNHFGLDFKSIARAFVINMRAGRTVQGGSTLTQQLAKNLFLKPERTYKRKVQEALLALQLEVRYTKDQILTAYLNRVYMGPAGYGVENASQGYFGKSSRQLSLSESAMLVGLLPAPSRYNPRTNPEIAADRAALVIKVMREQGYLDDQEQRSGELAGRRPVAESGSGVSARWFADYVLAEMEDRVGSEPGDVMIRTTLDANIQRAAEYHLKRLLEEEGDRHTVTQGAVIVMDRSGQIKAMVGGADYKKSQFNRVNALRQPGSAFKPVIWLTALQNGWSKDSMIHDTRLEIDGWTPNNWDNRYEGRITLDKALSRSSNVASIRLAREVGLPNVERTALALGITTEIRRDLSSALGTSEVTLLELTGAFASFANGGRAVWPHSITRIGGGATLLYESRPPSRRRIVEESAVAELTQMLEHVVSDGTGKRAALDGHRVAGKTGTTQNNRDALFVGYTGNYIAGIWLGNDDGTPMRRVSGGTLPAQLFADIMTEAHLNIRPAPLPDGQPGGGLDLFGRDRDDPTGGRDEGPGFWQRIFGASEEEDARPERTPRPRPSPRDRTRFSDPKGDRHGQ